MCDETNIKWPQGNKTELGQKGPGSYADEKVGHKNSPNYLHPLPPLYSNQYFTTFKNHNNLQTIYFTPQNDSITCDYLLYCNF